MPLRFVRMALPVCATLLCLIVLCSPSHAADTSPFITKPAPPKDDLFIQVKNESFRNVEVCTAGKAACEKLAPGAMFSQSQATGGQAESNFLVWLSQTKVNLCKTTVPLSKMVEVDQKYGVDARLVYNLKIVKPDDITNCTEPLEKH